MATIPGKKNMKGSDPSSVQEEMRIRFTRQLHQLREQNVNMIEFPPTLTNVERKFLHALAHELGLKSQSRGKGETRYITVTKKDTVGNSEAAVYDLPGDITHALQAYFASYPILPFELTSLQKIESLHRSKPSKGKPAAYSDDSYSTFQALRRGNPNFSSLQAKRQQLPANQYAADIIRLLQENPIILITGDTGCGKSTQIPQFIIDDATLGPVSRIAITQPRRISAISVAERVAYERSEQVGQLIGYNIRLENESSSETRVLFMTPGVLLRKFQDNPLLPDFNLIIIDEAHERDKHTEFLLILLRDLCAKRADLKVILMSATLHTQKLSTFFDDLPVLHIGSSMYPVQEFFLEHILHVTGHVNHLIRDSTIAEVVTREYHCLMCQKGFRSAEDLGTHAAFCFGPSELPASPSVRSQATAAAAEEEEGTSPLSDDDSDDDNVHDDSSENNEPEGQTSADIPPILRHEEDETLVRAYLSSWDDTLVDYELILSLITYILTTEYGKDNILIFLPGWDDIVRLQTVLENSDRFPTRAFKIYPLHSNISKKQQMEIFESVPQQKIILSTNIAETSITIDNIGVVIDTGRMKEKIHDPHVKLTYLKNNWISKSSALQRKGRAGRTRPGVCYHMYSTLRYESMAEFQQSELLRVPLEDIALQVALLLQHSDIDIHTFLSQAMDPPHPLTINNAISLLQSLQCLDEEEHVTLLGKLISDIPVSPCLGRMLVYSYLFHKTDDALKLACAMSYKDPFIIPSEQQRGALTKVKLRYTQHPSDHMVLVNLMNKYIDMKKHSSYGKLMQFCDEHFISHVTMNFIVDLYQRIKTTLAPFAVQVDASQLNLLMPLTTIALYPNYSVRRQSVKVYATEKGRKAKIHPSSINHQLCSGICSNSFELIGYQDMVSTVNTNPGGASLLMLPTSSICILTMLLTCGMVELLDDQSEDVERVQVLVDKWLKISLYESCYNIILALRHRLNKTINLCLKYHPITKVNNDLLQVLATVASLESDSMRIKREGAARYANKKELVKSGGAAKNDQRGGKGSKR